MTINCKGNLIDLNSPKVMGILNLTPDSFFDGGKYKNTESVLSQVQAMLNEGATFIDVGAYSSKPHAKFVSETEELNRILPIIKILVTEFPDILISVDTFRSKIAKACILEGAAIINDISAGKLDSNMLETVGKLGVPYIMMHMRGTPQNMHEFTQYDSLIKDILFYFSEQIALAKKHLIKDIIIDPGFGFAKTQDQNFEILKHLDLFTILEKSILTGVSRKSMIYKTLNTTPNHALNGTTVLNTLALTKGANILRVHDVKEAVESIKLTHKIQ
ncbi:dihydropteroate synthase [Bizionia sp. KMM 8389]